MGSLLFCNSLGYITNALYVWGHKLLVLVFIISDEYNHTIIIKKKTIHSKKDSLELIFDAIFN